MLHATSIHSFILLPWGMLIGSGLVLFFERKLIAIAQKRLGISFLGRHGWAHLPADVFKFWTKSSSRDRSWLELGLLGSLGVFAVWSFLCSALFVNTGTVMSEV